VEPKYPLYVAYFFAMERSDPKDEGLRQAMRQPLPFELCLHTAENPAEQRWPSSDIAAYLRRVLPIRRNLILILNAGMRKVLAQFEEI
jgi:hypothetical protein